MQGGCQLPLGVYAEKIEDQWNIHVSYASDKDEGAQISVYESASPEGMASLIVEDLQNVED
jgi:porphobilinogen deaminase